MKSKLLLCHADNVVIIYRAINEIAQLIDLILQLVTPFQKNFLLALKFVILHNTRNEHSERRDQKDCQQQSYQHLGIGRIKSFFDRFFQIFFVDIRDIRLGETRS